MPSRCYAGLSMQDARSVVVSRIETRIGAFPDLEPTTIDVTSLEPRDAALAVAIDRAVHRRWLTMAAVLADVARRPCSQMDPPVAAALLVGSAQLLLLDRLPDHAVINHAVEWTRVVAKRPRATGFVNGVLRSVARLRSERIDEGDPMAADQILRSDGSAWRLKRAVLAKGGLAAQTSMPEEAMGRLRANTSEDADEIAIASLAEPPLIVTAVSPLPDGLRAHAKDGFAVLEPTASLPDTLATNPAIRVQDPTSAAALESAASLRPDQVMDLCAGRGTKTRQLAVMFPEAAIFATEPNDDRRLSLQASTASLPQVTVLDPGDDGPPSPFDLVVADVPCSNSGVMARRPEARYRWDETHVASLVTLQQSILNDALFLLAPGGHLLYATCSLDRDENERQADWLVRRGLKHVSSSRLLPCGRLGNDGTTWCDGGFSALFRAPMAGF